VTATESQSTVDLWEAVQPPLPDMPEVTGEGQVYFFWDGRLYIKIGWTARPIKRRGGELRAIPIMAIPGSRLLEKRLHRRYAALRQGDSEWFWPDDLLINDLFYLAGKIKPGGDERAYKILYAARRAGQWRPAA